MTPPRLHVVTALHAPVAVILRRGPAGKVASLGWNRTTGEITMGQRLAGRIYEYRCDLSPDGRHLVYFATRQSRPEGHRAWTAVSRAPFLRALHLIPQDSTWGGGGAFAADGALWPPRAGAQLTLPDGLRAAAADAFAYSTDGIFQGGTHGAMLELRGWRHLDGTSYNARHIRNLPGGGVLEHSYRLSGPNRAIVSSSYRLALAGQGASGTGWEWADLWQDRLQFAARGSLWQAQINPAGELGRPILIHDFSEMTFVPLPAPYDGVTDP